MIKSDHELHPLYARHDEERCKTQTDLQREEQGRKEKRLGREKIEMCDRECRIGENVEHISERKEKQ